MGLAAGHTREEIGRMVEEDPTILNENYHEFQARVAREGPRVSLAGRNAI